MNRVKHLLVVNRPYEYITSNQKMILDDFTKIIESEVKSFCYLYLNNNYYENLILYSCLKTVEENLMSHESMLTILKIGDKVLYNGKTYIFHGKDTDSDLYSLVSVAKKNNSLTLYVPLNILEEKVTLLEREQFRRSDNYRRTVAGLLGLQTYSNITKISEVIIAPKATLDRLFNKIIIFYKQKYYLGNFCSGRFLSKHENFKPIPNTNNYEQPTTIFASDILAITNKLMNNQLPGNVKRISIYGMKVYNENQYNSLIDLIYQSQKKNIQINLFADTHSIMNANGIKLLGLVNQDKNWFIENENVSALNIDYRFVSTNIEFKNTYEQLKLIKNDMEENYKYFWIKKEMSKIIHLICGQISNNSEEINCRINNLDECLAEYKENSLKEAVRLLAILSANRFKFQLDKMIKSELVRYKKIAIVVDNNIKNEIEACYKSCTVLSADDEIKESYYSSFDKIILINLYSSQRRKWIMSSICSDIVIYYPDVKMLEVKKMLFNDKKYLSAIVKSSKEDLLVNRYLKSVDIALGNMQNTEMPAAEDEEEIELENEIIDLEINYNEILKNFKNKKTNIYYTKEETMAVDIKWGITLDNGHSILATEFARFLVLENGMTKRKSVDSLTDTDKLIFFDIPYSDQLYRKQLLYRLKHPMDILKEENYIINDFYWKKTLLEYIHRLQLSPKRLMKKFQEFNYSEMSLGFYSSWMNINTMPIVPRDKNFIKYVGLITNNPLLTQYYKEYFEASNYIKEKLSSKRHNMLDSLDGISFGEIKNSYMDQYSTAHIVTKTHLNMKDVPRYLTNKILRSDL